MNMLQTTADNSHLIPKMISFIGILPAIFINLLGLNAQALGQETGAFLQHFYLTKDSIADITFMDSGKMHGPGEN
jgi:hypothetical protein